MKESFWAMYIVAFGAMVIMFIFLIQNITNTDEQNMVLLKEVTEAAMYDALDYSTYRTTGNIKIDREKYVEVFLRRFAENASLSTTYKIQFYDINEIPPKVSIKVTSNERSSLFSSGGETVDFVISNRIDAILETPYSNKEGE